ncbi:GIY-YIG nuclease family protein [Spirosoma validum]|uniref:GIY-YIG nuclease family protein n=1 Tax=Spirosoma validum TaxID=2771355 RepID=A0A927B5Q2_9BACT|nr:GIY-YIG nuclease family protein [Spirosoma validum]MBD2755925.1 GIY-YIG nuclease family protein [Spirosoma validum]
MKNALKMHQKHLDLSEILDNARQFQNQPCVYYLIDDNDEVTYVGQTKNLYSQLITHRFSGKEFVRYNFFPCEEIDLDRLEQEAISKFRPVHNKPPTAQSTSGYLSKPLICLKHNITPVAFDYLREAFGLESSRSFGNTKYYKPEDVESWLRRFKGLVIRGRHVLQVRPDYLAVGVSTRTKQIQLYRKR